MACIMEREPVRAETYSTLVFQGVSLSAFWALIVELVRKTSRKLKAFPWLMLGQIFAVAYILGFSTLVSVMTGYSTVFHPWVTRPDNQNRVDLSDLRVPTLVIVDGSRVGLHDNYPVYGHLANLSQILTCKTFAFDPYFSSTDNCSQTAGTTPFSRGSTWPVQMIQTKHISTATWTSSLRGTQLGLCTRIPLKASVSVPSK